MQLSDAAMITGTAIIIALELLVLFLVAAAFFCAIFKGGDFSFFWHVVHVYLSVFGSKKG